MLTRTDALKVLRRCALPVIVLSTSGCGWIFVERPPVGHEQMATFTCTDSKVAPHLDMVWAGLQVLNGLLVAADDTYTDRGATIALNASFATLAVLSANSGYSKVDECRAARLALAERSNDEEPEAASEAPTATAAVGPVGYEWPTGFVPGGLIQPDALSVERRR